MVNAFEASIVHEKALKVGPARMDIAYQPIGNPDAPLVLLIMGARGPNPSRGRTRFAVRSPTAASK